MGHGGLCSAALPVFKGVSPVRRLGGQCASVRRRIALFFARRLGVSQGSFQPMGGRRKAPLASTWRERVAEALRAAAPPVSSSGGHLPTRRGRTGSGAFEKKRASLALSVQEGDGGRWTVDGRRFGTPGHVASAPLAGLPFSNAAAFPETIFYRPSTRHRLRGNLLVAVPVLQASPAARWHAIGQSRHGLKPPTFDV